MYTTLGFSEKLGHLERCKQALYLCTEKENRGWEREILVRQQVDHVAKKINPSSFRRNSTLHQ